jgi:hypothetical protein
VGLDLKKKNIDKFERRGVYKKKCLSSNSLHCDGSVISSWLVILSF